MGKTVAQELDTRNSNISKHVERAQSHPQGDTHRLPTHPPDRPH